MVNKIISFLSELNHNNNREWFTENKRHYLEAKKNFEELVAILIPKLAEDDPQLKGLDVKKTVFRIYRDVRFSKDKRPYKTNMGAYMAKGGRKSPYAGYYIHCEPGGSFLGGGMYHPPGDVLKKIRSEIYFNANEFKQIINSDAFIKTYGEIRGQKLVRPPVGFPKDFSDIELLKFKDYTAFTMVKDDFFDDSGFIKNTVDIFRILKPFNDFLNKAIT